MIPSTAEAVVRYQRLKDSAAGGEQARFEVASKPIGRIMAEHGDEAVTAMDNIAILLDVDYIELGNVAERVADQLISAIAEAFADPTGLIVADRVFDLVKAVAVASYSEGHMAGIFKERFDPEPQEGTP